MIIILLLVSYKGYVRRFCRYNISRVRENARFRREYHRARLNITRMNK